MKNTIKSDNERLIIKEELLDDNSLLQYEYDRENDKVLLAIRFIKHHTIQEHILTILSIHEYASELDDRVKINEDHTSIAIFDKKDNDYVLRDCYNLQEHNYAINDFVDIEFNNKFPNIKINNYLVLKKKK